MQHRAEGEQPFSMRLRPEDQARIEALRRSLKLPAEVRITTTDIIRSALASAVAALPAEIQDDSERPVALTIADPPAGKAKTRRARQERSAA